MDRQVPLLYVLILMMVPGLGDRADRLSRDKLLPDAAVSVSGPITVAIGIIMLIVIVTIVAALASDYFNSTDDAEQAFSTANFTDSTLASIASPFGLLVGVVLVIALATKIFDAV